MLQKYDKKGVRCRGVRSTHLFLKFLEVVMRTWFSCVAVAMFAALALLSLGWAPLGWTQGGATYVGSKECADCHVEQFESFMMHSGKAKSDRSVQVMAPKLTDAELRECYACHTTGYGRPGGFISYEKTPDLGHVGCESCHGPGSSHVRTGDPADLAVRVTLDTCRPCHEDERVRVINFRPMLHSGAH